LLPSNEAGLVDPPLRAAARARRDEPLRTGLEAEAARGPRIKVFLARLHQRGSDTCTGSLGDLRRRPVNAIMPTAAIIVEDLEEGALQAVKLGHREKGSPGVHA